ncbi:MAG: hypothetical protein ABW110_00335, partial [Steroidobacteraceae bacterium]
QNNAKAVTEDDIAAALALQSGAMTNLVFELCGSQLPVHRLDAALAPAALQFVRDPQPRAGERTSSGAQD